MKISIVIPNSVSNVTSFEVVFFLMLCFTIYMLHNVIIMHLMTDYNTASQKRGSIFTQKVMTRFFQTSTNCWL